MRPRRESVRIVDVNADDQRPAGLWASPEFLSEVTAWVTRACSIHRLVPTGEREQPHCRPWSSAIRFETDRGRLWFKVNGPGTRHEPALLALLHDLVPDLVPEPLAVDTARGWSLVRDAGPVLRSDPGPDGLWSEWERVVQRYAEAQIQLGGHLAQLRRTGARTVSPTTLPDQAAELLEELAGTPPAGGGLDPAEAVAVAERLPAYAAWCAELAAAGLPDSVQHDDLHSANICRSASGQTRIIDWGDASLGFPLATMLCTMNSIAHHGLTSLDDPRVLRVRDAYLEPFTAFASRDELARCVDLARRTGCVTRALSYRAALGGEPVSVHADHDFPVRGWFLEILDEAITPA